MIRRATRGSPRTRPMTHDHTVESVCYDPAILSG
jgi:hypothetical protein